MKNKILGMKNVMKLFTLQLMALCLIAGLMAPAGTAKTAEAKSKTTKTIYKKVQKAYGKKFKLSSKNMIKVEKKNVFGDYSKVVGVSHKLFDSYTAARVTNSKYEYVCFICKAGSKKNVKKIKTALKKYVKSESESNKNYYSSEGKKLMKNAAIGSKDKFVYLFILDTSKNKKAVKAFKKA
ncbi:MAG: DUF4358 domain-containing protein [Lachnospiraceae bacterium]|nr:DUF4358 domain-containing protein [Lachnospiraceae bacterium]